MSELTLSKISGNDYGDSAIMFPELFHEPPQNNKTYQGTLPFQSDRAYSYMLEGGLLDLTRETYRAAGMPTIIESCKFLFDSTNALGVANRNSWSFFSSEDYHSNLRAYPRTSRTGFLVAILSSSENQYADVNNYGFQACRSEIPTTLVVLKNIGDFKVFDIPIKVYDGSNRLIANGKLKTRITFNYSSNMGTGVTFDSLGLFIDTLFTGTKNSSTIHPSFSLFFGWTTGRRILDYDDYPMPDSIPKFTTNDIQTCDYT